VPDADAAIGTLVTEVHDGDAVLVKASRAVGLERVVDYLAHREPVA
jgi:UDP-N-acetylmuramyl pentapeptide synthase